MTFTLYYFKHHGVKTECLQGTVVHEDWPSTITVVQQLGWPLGGKGRVEKPGCHCQQATQWHDDSWKSLLLPCVTPASGAWLYCYNQGLVTLPHKDGHKPILLLKLGIFEARYSFCLWTNQPDLPNIPLSFRMLQSWFKLYGSGLCLWFFNSRDFFCTDSVMLAQLEGDGKGTWFSSTLMARLNPNISMATSLSKRRVEGQLNNRKTNQDSISNTINWWDWISQRLLNARIKALTLPTNPCVGSSYSYAMSHWP